MANDISLAVDDGGRRMAYAELAQARAISLASARRLARRHHWPRQVGNDGIVRVIVPLGQLRPGPRPTLAKGPETPASRDPGPAQAAADGTDPGTATDGPGPWPTPAVDAPRSDLGTDPLSCAVDSLREQLAIANRRIDELQAALTEERHRLITILTGPRLPWWRRWFR